MAIGVIADFIGGNLDVYYKTNEKLNFKSARPGALTHWVAGTDNSFRVVDSWEDRESLQSTWYEGPTVIEVIRGLMPGGEFPQEPNIEIYELHDIQRDPPTREGVPGAERNDVGVIMRFEGATLDQYDQMSKRVSLSKPTAGRINYWAAKTDSGVCICSAWESREAYDRAADQQALVAGDSPFPAEPTSEFFDAHHAHGMRDLPKVPAGRPGAKVRS